MSRETSESLASSANNVAYARRCGLRLHDWRLILPVLMFVFLVGLTVLLRLPDSVAGAAICVTSLFVLVALIVLIVYAQGIIRAFCVGAIVPTLIVGILVTYMFIDLTYGMGRDGYIDPLYPLKRTANGLRFVAITWSLMAAASGGLSVILRWYFVGRGRAGCVD